MSLCSLSFNRPLYTLKEKFISELMYAFSNSYPSITNRLENIRSQLPRLVVEEISHSEIYALIAPNYKKIVNMNINHL